MLLLHRRYFGDRGNCRRPGWNAGLRHSVLRRYCRHARLRRYAGLTFFGESDPALPNNVVGLTYYHLNMKGDIDPKYHIFPEGDMAFGNRLRANPPRGLAPEAMVAPLRFVVIDPCSANPADNFASVRQAPDPGAIEAGRLQPGTPVLIDGIKDGWAHLARANPFLDLGFVAVSLLRQAS